MAPTVARTIQWRSGSRVVQPELTELVQLPLDPKVLIAVADIGPKVIMTEGPHSVEAMTWR